MAYMAKVLANNMVSYLVCFVNIDNFYRLMVSSF